MRWTRWSSSLRASSSSSPAHFQLFDTCTSSYISSARTSLRPLLGGGAKGPSPRTWPPNKFQERLQENVLAAGAICPVPAYPIGGAYSFLQPPIWSGRKLATPSQYPHPALGPLGLGLRPSPLARKKEAWPLNTMGWVRLCFDLWWTVVPLLYDFHQLYSLFCSLQLIRNKFTRLRARFQLN